MIKAYIVVQLSNADSYRYVNSTVNDSLGKDEQYYAYYGPGFQELGLDQVSTYDESGLKPNTTYYFTVNIDGGGATEYSITTGSNTTFGNIIHLMNNQTLSDGAEWNVERNGDIRCTSTSTAAGTSIALSAGTTGTNLFSSLKGFTSFESAQPGDQLADQTGSGLVYGDFTSIRSNITAHTANERVLWPDDGGTTEELIRKNLSQNIGDEGTTVTSIYCKSVESVQIIEWEVDDK